MEDVELVEREKIEVLEDELLRHEVPADVEMAPAPAETRPVLDLEGRDLPRCTGDRRAAEDRRRQQLPQRLRAVKDAGRLERADRGFIGADGEAIALVTEVGERRVEREGDARRRSRRCDRERQTGRGTQQIAEQLRMSAQVVACRDRRRRAELERARARRQLRWDGDQADGGHRGILAARASRPLRPPRAGCRPPRSLSRPSQREERRR